MKINGTNYKVLENSVHSVFEKHGDLSSNYKERGLSFDRFCFDVFYATKIRIGDGIGLSGDIIVPDCKDENIKTAIKKILSSMNVKSW